MLNKHTALLFFVFVLAFQYFNGSQNPLANIDIDNLPYNKTPLEYIDQTLLTPPSLKHNWAWMFCQIPLFINYLLPKTIFSSFLMHNTGAICINTVVIGFIMLKVERDYYNHTLQRNNLFSHDDIKKKLEKIKLLTQKAYLHQKNCNNCLIIIPDTIKKKLCVLYSPQTKSDLITYAIITCIINLCIAGVKEKSVLKTFGFQNIRKLPFFIIYNTLFYCVQKTIYNIHLRRCFKQLETDLINKLEKANH
ncbi:hypothetical protein EKK58_03325 [Candidatus Dependentiae bacterium]|nr:MAG: hypothetical protein EKK58_03325 [Candidatus Dependentiae bacterium]